ncbi:aromatic acid exporter family protein [Luteipulveratus sp. YIM 133132]|uniref:FUSC family protein n=1 Tax=Luteipulveratus flavus TaxID=3031728 RepID=UPI0023AF9263|nr:FUSC family protein [Luteipulveratus sp. YIM 133132]MDE9365398.1 aromatic acid exporter family protein [Luteipulveratus sp. YIM 133132]
MRFGELRPRARTALRRLVWRVWPSAPATWSEVPRRLRPEALGVARLTSAAVISYVIADWISPGILDLTAPLTALLVVQASTVSTLLMALVRVGAVLTGVLVAVGITTWIGLSWWSLAIVVATSLVLAKLFRLGPQSLETAISAMLILAVSSGTGLAAEVRVVNTLVGALVGIAFSLLFPVQIPNTTARDAVARVPRELAALLNEVAQTVGDRPPHPEEARAWLDWVNSTGRELSEATQEVDTIQERRRLNPRALAATTIHPELRDSLARLDRCLSAERALVVMVGQQVAEAEDDERRERAGELAKAFAVVLDDIAGGLRAFGDRIGADLIESADEARERMLDVVEESRAVLAELAMIDVDPRRDRDVWMLQASVLAALDQILRQLDLDHPVETTAAWTTRHGLDELVAKSLRPLRPGKPIRPHGSRRV